VQQIRCEAARNSGSGRRTSGRQHRYEFELNINETNDASAGVTLIIPFTTGSGGPLPSVLTSERAIP
jgi:hypothetical protein